MELETKDFITSWYTSPASSRFGQPAAIGTDSANKPILPQSCLDPVQESYVEATAYFKANLTKDECKRVWIDGKTDLQDVQDSINEAKRMYEGPKKSKARSWLSKFSSRVMYYGVIMDTLSQHHPEYVSLVWGTIKFIFVGVLNQEELITQLSKALVSIADALPRAKIHTILYRTDIMQHAVAMLYACIIKFMHRAMCWYKESKLRHMVSAFTRPASLRFKDLVEEISELSSRVDRLAATSAHAELRDIHEAQSATQATVNLLHENFQGWTAQNISIFHQLSSVMQEQQSTRISIAQIEQKILARLENYHNIGTSRYIDTNRQIYDLQYSRILESIASKNVLISPEAALKHCRSMRKNRRLYGTPGHECASAIPSLQRWVSLDRSSLILIKSTHASRNIVRDLATDVVDLILKSKGAVVWILNSPRKATMKKSSAAIEVLKQIVLQTMQINTQRRSERSISISAARFEAARTESDWFDLLGSALAGIPRLFIIVDIEVAKSASQESSVWPVAFLSLFQKISVRDTRCVVKVALVYYHNEVKVPLKAKVDVVSIGKPGRVTSSLIAGRREANVVRSVRAPRTRVLDSLRV